MALSVWVTDLTRRNVLLLACCQALSGAGNTVLIAAAALVAEFAFALAQFLAQIVKTIQHVEVNILADIPGFVELFQFLALDVVGAQHGDEFIIVVQGLGISVLSRRALDLELAAGAVSTLRIKGLALRRHFYLAWDRRRARSPLCREFVDFVTA